MDNDRSVKLLGTNAVEYEIDRRDWPRCAKCHMPVEGFTATDLGNGLVFVATCHGDKQVVELPDSIWKDALGTDLGDMGPAFADEGTYEFETDF